ncbi:MAG: MurT ligase domain-containing protein [Clostridium sp.]|uniref:MurT ligase domain-containing protein n=1 Tax=Clostridium sp. TaxID=1506 RepID=UPI003070C1C4
MWKIKINSLIAIISSKIILKLSTTLFKGGSNFPGKVALALDKNILSTITKGYKVVLVTGTNGKTTTTSMIYNILINAGKTVVTNGTGANMNTGIVASFISNYKFFRKSNDIYAVIETDEAYLKFITESITPEIITVTNLFRDQLDRYGEVHTTYSKILEGIHKTPNSLLILNGDESLLGKIDAKNPSVYYGFNTAINENTVLSVNADSKFCKFCKTPYSYEYITYNHLGNYFCPKCGYKRPELKFKVDTILNISPSGSDVIINNEDYYINQSGEYNIYNGLCALAVTSELGITSDCIKTSLSNQKSSFGRQESIIINGKEIKIILVKNPAGYNQALNTILLNNDSIDLTLMLNDNYADGTDVSWIWDVDFEKLAELNINDIAISGIRLYDMAVRLKTANLNENNFIFCESDDDLISSLTQSKSNTNYVLVTYTAMLHLRKLLHSKGYINKIW